jgi:hypothetical protein
MGENISFGYGVLGISVRSASGMKRNMGLQGICSFRGCRSYAGGSHKVGNGQGSG